MKDYSQSTLEGTRPAYSALHCIDHALSAIYRDKQHTIHDELVNGLCFEELIGTLLQAKNEITDLEKTDEDWENENYP